MPTLKTPVSDAKIEPGEFRVSETIEEYCEAIYNLAVDKEGPVKSVNLAERMGVTPATVFATLQRMQKSGLVSMDPHTHQIRLLPEGEQVALRLARRHNLLERFLFDHLKLGWAEIHDEACRMEHAMSVQIEEALNRFLNYPATCPHGNPIPGNGYRLPAGLRPLDKIEAGSRVEVIHISEEGEHQAGLLDYLYQYGILPGVILLLKGKSPFNETIQVVDNAGREIAFGIKLAQAIRVKPVAFAAEAPKLKLLRPEDPF
jgi:DtxR family Mn-dependent transcriptional regulator